MLLCFPKSSFIVAVLNSSIAFRDAQMSFEKSFHNLRIRGLERKCLFRLTSQVCGCRNRRRDNVAGTDARTPG